MIGYYSYFFKFYAKPISFLLNWFCRFKKGHDQICGVDGEPFNKEY